MKTLRRVIVAALEKMVEELTRPEWSAQPKAELYFCEVSQRDFNTIVLAQRVQRIEKHLGIEP